jgi:hypothetical protein
VVYVDLLYTLTLDCHEHRRIPAPLSHNYSYDSTLISPALPALSVDAHVMIILGSFLQSSFLLGL